MSRKILAESQLSPAALEFISQNHANIVDEVISSVEKNKIVVVGMDQNPVVKKARKVLEAANMPYTYLSYGSYFSQWKQRLAIKLWSGWPTYPQVFIDGKLIGGCAELIKLLAVKK
jgi:glutaredoxin-related protein